MYGPSSEFIITIKGGCRRAEKSRKELMMKAAKLGLAGPGAGQKQSRNRPGAKQKQSCSRSRSRGGAGEEQGRNRAGVKLG